MTQVIILAAGKGTRMGNLEVPKVLVPFKGKPLVSYILDTVEGLNLETRAIMVVGFKHELVEQEFGDRCEYVLQEDLLGTGHAVLMGLSRASADTVIVLYGDMPLITRESLFKLVNLGSGDSPVAMLTCKVEDFNDQNSSMKAFGRVIRGDAGLIESIKEYRDCTEEEKQIKEINPGIYLFKTRWLKSALMKLNRNNDQNEYLLTDVIKQAVVEGENISTDLIKPIEVAGVNSVDDLEILENLNI